MDLLGSFITVDALFQFKKRCLLSDIHYLMLYQ